MPHSKNGNQTGSRAHTVVSQAARALLSSPVPNDPEGRTVADVLCQRLAQMALGGDLPAMKELFNRAEGRPRQTPEIHDAGDNLQKIVDWMAERSKEIGPPVGDSEDV